MLSYITPFFMAKTFCMPFSSCLVINSHVYLFTKMTHLLMRNFFVLNSISIAFNISIAWMTIGKAA